LWGAVKGSTKLKPDIKHESEASTKRTRKELTN
jgi:hypothetical protein